MHPFHIGDRFCGRAHVRLGYDFQQRRPRAVEIDTGHALEVFVQGFTRVLFQVGAGDPDPFAAAIVEGDIDLATTNDRQFKLADLIAFRKIRVKIVFACEYRAPRDLAIHRQAEFHGHLHYFPIEHRQDAGITEIDQVRLAVGLRTVSRRTARKNLAPGGELSVYFQPDYDFPFDSHAVAVPPTVISGARVCQSVTC